MEDRVKVPLPAVVVNVTVRVLVVSEGKAKLRLLTEAARGLAAVTLPETANTCLRRLFAPSRLKRTL